jgi:hypothetical protein
MHGRKDRTAADILIVVGGVVVVVMGFLIVVGVVFALFFAR